MVTIFGLLLLSSAMQLPLTSHSAGAKDPATAELFSRLFVRNTGQYPADVGFAARLSDVTVFAETRAIAFALPSDGRGSGVFVRMIFEGARLNSVIEPEGASSCVMSYFLGTDPHKWRRDVGAYSSIRYRGLYDGVDLVLHQVEGRPKYDIVATSLASLRQIHIKIEGATLSLPSSQSLLFGTAMGQFSQPMGTAYQVTRQGKPKSVVCRYRVLDNTHFCLDVEGAEDGLPIIIDPQLVWGSYLGSSSDIGGPGDWGTAIATGPDGDVYVAGEVSGLDFPATPGVYNHPGVSRDMFVARLRSSDGALVYSAIFGGSGTDERAYAIQVDAQGEAVVAGWTRSSDFPTTVGALDRANQDPNLPPDSSVDGFVLKLSSQGNNLIFSTYLGNDGHDEVNALAIAPAGSIIAAGITYRPAPPLHGFSTTPGAFQTTTPVDVEVGFVARLDPTGSSLQWSTLFGSRACNVTGVALDANENVTIVGEGTTVSDTPVTAGAYVAYPPGPSQQNVFVSRLSSDGSGLLWGSLFGGEGNEWPRSVALDAEGAPYVAGWTNSATFPTTAGAFQEHASPAFDDAFVTRLDPSGSFPVYSTRLGQIGYNECYGIIVDPSGIATIAGTASGSWFATPGAFDHLCQQDFFVTRIHPSGSRLLYSTCVGGLPEDECRGISQSKTGRLSVVGWCDGGLFPTTAGSASPSYIGGASDAVVATIDPYLQGITSTGFGTPGCRGPLLMNSDRMPRASASDFALICSAVPPNASGWLVIGSSSLPVGLTVHGAILQIDLAARTLRIPVVADQHGFVEKQLVAGLMRNGSTFFAQFLFPARPGCDGGAPATWMTSNALRIDVQP